MSDTVERPEVFGDEMLDYLDEMRDSGAINMFGAAPYLQDAFGLSRAEAREVHIYWMHTFGERHPPKS